MGDRETYAYAMWYLDDRGHADYRLTETEQEAADEAASVDVYSDGSALGLQRADGSTLRVNGWEAYREARRRLLEVERNRPAPAPIPTRKAKDPFEGRLIHIETTEPDWLGERHE